MGTAGDWLDKTIFLWELLVGALTDPLMKATLAMILSPKSEGTSTTPVPLPDPPVAFQMLVLLPEVFSHLPAHPTIQTFDLMNICDCVGKERHPIPLTIFRQTTMFADFWLRPFDLWVHGMMNQNGVSCKQFWRSAPQCGFSPDYYSLESILELLDR